MKRALHWAAFGAIGLALMAVQTAWPTVYWVGMAGMITFVGVVLAMVVWSER